MSPKGRIFKNSNTYICRLNNGCGVLYNIDSKRVCFLNHVGLKIFEFCDGTRTLDQVVEVIARQFSQDPAKIYEDILKTIKKLENEGFIGFNHAPLT